MFEKCLKCIVLNRYFEDVLFGRYFTDFSFASWGPDTLKVYCVDLQRSLIKIFWGRENKILLPFRMNITKKPLLLL